MNAPDKKIVTWLLVLSIWALCYAALFAVIKLWYPIGLGHDQLRLHLIHFSIIYLGWMVVFFVHGMFDGQIIRSARTIVFNTASAMAINLIVAVAYFYFQPNLILTPRRFLLFDVLLMAALIVLWLLILRYVLAERLTEQFYILSMGQDDGWAAELEQYRFLGIRIMGTITQAELGKLSGMANARLVIPDTHRMDPELLKQLYGLRSQLIVFYNYRNLYENLARKVYLGNLNEVWFLENVSNRQRKFYNFAKRIIDIIIGLIGLAVLVVIYLPAGALIKLTSKGPIMIKQSRTGQYGTIFIVYKLRSMAMTENPGDTWTAKGDNRITPVGSFLRRLRLDELPQSVNLLRGNMSLVGPRPEQPHIVEQLRASIPFYDERHTVKPGITGWGQLNVYARTVEQSKIKLQYDLYYIKHRSFLFDLEIILKTFYHILTSNDT